MFKINNKNIRTRWELCSKLTITTLEPGHWRRSGVFIVNLEHIPQLVLNAGWDMDPVVVCFGAH